VTAASDLAAPEPATGRWAALGLVLLVALFHGPTLANGFVYDDAWTLVDNPIVRDPGHLADLLGPNLARAGVPDAGRPVLLATEMLDHALWGNRPAGYHLQNLLWHAAVVLLLFAGLRRLQGESAVPLVVAALVAVHPINVEPVAAINYREDLLSAFFLLLCLITVEKARWSPGRLPGSGWRALAFVFAVLGCLSKENAYLAPLLLVLVDLHRPTRARRRWADPLLLAMAAALVFLWRWWVIGAPGQVSRTAELPALTGSRLADIGRACLAFFQGALQFIWPATFSPEYPSRTMERSGALLAFAVVGLLALAALMLWRRRRTPWFSLGIAWAVVAYLPNLGFLPLTNLRADRYFYLASFGFSLAVVSTAVAVLARWPRLRGRTVLEIPLAAWIGTVAVLGLGVRALRQGRVWRNDLTVFSAASQHAPRSQRAWLGLAAARLRAGQSLPALHASERALALGPDFHARQMHGLILLGQGDLEGARQQLERALVEGPPEHHRAQVLNNLGYVEVKLGRIDRALERFALARTVDPHFDRPWLNAARAHLDRGELERARALLEQLLTAVPESVDGWKQLAALEEKAGRLMAARAAFTRVRALAPGDEDAARALRRLGP
jgi:protein O-mannosyl-transferase